jgi:tetratricopeptide (TPR) repeat protein
MAAGDRARDRGEWAVAAGHYEKALAIDPNRAPIWVQYGHALKEQGDLAGAEAAYEKSIEIDEANADTHLQLGHVLKLQGRKTDAISAYLGALLRDPESSEPRRELAALDYPLTDFQAALTDLADSAPLNLVHLGSREDSAKRRVAALLARSEARARAQLPDFCVVDVSLASAVGWAFLPFDFHHSVLVNVYRGNRGQSAPASCNRHRPQIQLVPDRLEGLALPADPNGFDRIGLSKGRGRRFCSEPSCDKRNSAGRIRLRVSVES